MSVEKVYRSLGPLLQENTFLLPKPGQVAFLLGLTLQEEKTRLRQLDCEWPGSTGSQSSQESLPFLVTSCQFSLQAGPQASGQLSMAFLQAPVGPRTFQSKQAATLPARPLSAPPALGPSGKLQTQQP